MTGWNMPPGMNASDIPGNRRIDVIIERLAMEFCANCLKEKCNDDRNPDWCEYSKEFKKLVDKEIGLI